MVNRDREILFELLKRVWHVECPDRSIRGFSFVERWTLAADSQFVRYLLNREVLVVLEGIRTARALDKLFSPRKIAMDLETDVLVTRYNVTAITGWLTLTVSAATAIGLYIRVSHAGAFFFVIGIIGGGIVVTVAGPVRRIERRTIRLRQR